MNRNYPQKQITNMFWLKTVPASGPEVVSCYHEESPCDEVAPCDTDEEPRDQIPQTSSVESLNAATIEARFHPQHVDSRTSLESSSHTVSIMIEDQGSGHMADSTSDAVPAIGKDDPKDPSPLLSFKESLGFMGLLSIIGGHVGILAIIGFLIFLWCGYGPAPEAALATYVWRQIALNDWMPQTITLCSLVLRVIVSVQSTVCTSMIAALIIEKRSAPRSQAARFSILRSVNDGPRKLVEMMLSSKTGAMLRHIEFWLAILMTVITLGLQFSSTILLFDVRNFRIVGDVSKTQVPSLLSYREDDFVFGLLGGAFASSIPTYAVFAEAPSNSDATPDSHGFSDTGLVQRGFLPVVGSDNRTSLRQFHGNMMTMNSRVSCMRPLIDAHHVFLESDGTMSHFVIGRLQYAASLQVAQASSELPCDSPECQDLYFQCPIPLSTDREDQNWVSLPCLVGGVGGQLWETDLNPKWDSADKAWSMNSSIHLIITTNMRRNDSANLPTEGSMGLGDPYQEWQSYELVPDRRINITMCFSAANLARKSVHVVTQDVLSEPTVNWSLTSIQYDTSGIQRLMGIDSPHAQEERGVLTMDILGEPDDGPPDSIAHSMIILDPEGLNEYHSIGNLTDRLLELLVFTSLTQNMVVNASTVLCYSCDANGYLVHPIFAMLFSSVIAETNRAANALQSYMTTIGWSLYDSYLNSLGVRQQAEMATTKMVQTPGSCSHNGCGGFIAVITLVGIHLVYVVVIVMLYVTQIRYSLYDNVWHTVSQIVGNELMDILGLTNNMGDKAAKPCFEGGGDYHVKLGKVPGTNTIGFFPSLGSR